MHVAGAQHPGTPGSLQHPLTCLLPAACRAWAALVHKYRTHCIHSGAHPSDEATNTAHGHTADPLHTHGSMAPADTPVPLISLAQDDAAAAHAIRAACEQTGFFLCA